MASDAPLPDVNADGRADLCRDRSALAALPLRGPARLRSARPPPAGPGRPRRPRAGPRPRRRAGSPRAHPAAATAPDRPKRSDSVFEPEDGGRHDPVLARIEDGAPRARAPIPVRRRVSDTAVAEFGGDGRSDVRLATSIGRDELVRPGPAGLALATVEAHDGLPSRLGVAADGAVALAPERETLDGPATLFLGAGSRAHPWGEPRLAPDDPVVLARPAALDDPDTRAHDLRRDPATGRRRVEIGKAGRIRFGAEIHAEAPVGAVHTSDDARSRPAATAAAASTSPGPAPPAPARTSPPATSTTTAPAASPPSGPAARARRPAAPHQSAVIDVDADGQLDVPSAAGRNPPPQDGVGAGRLHRNLGEGGQRLRLELDAAFDEAVRFGLVRTTASAHRRRRRAPARSGRPAPAFRPRRGSPRRSRRRLPWRPGGRAARRRCGREPPLRRRRARQPLRRRRGRPHARRRQAGPPRGGPRADRFDGGRDRGLVWTEGEDRIALVGVSGPPEIARGARELPLSHAEGPAAPARSTPPETPRPRASPPSRADPSRQGATRSVHRASASAERPARERAAPDDGDPSRSSGEDVSRTPGSGTPSRAT